MSQVSRGKHDWFKENYDKIILLVALLILLASCAWLILQIQSSKSAITLSMARIGWKGQPVELKDTLPFDTVLSSAREAASAKLSVPERTTVSAMRVSCIKCGRPIAYDALECPFCLAPQPEIFNSETLDTDGDGIPDKVELAWGLDPQNAADAMTDSDGDGFTNLEEYSAKTDPKDPAKLPDPIVKLRVGAIRPVPFVLRFVSVSKFADGSMRFQLNLQTLERTYFASLGQVVLGYKVDSYDDTGKEGEILNMVRQSDQRAVRLVKGKPVTEQELAILFYSLIDRVPLKPPKRLNDLLEYRGKEYKVVDIQGRTVVIQNVKTGEKVTVPLMTAEEKSGPQVAPVAVVPATSGGPALPW